MEGPSNGGLLYHEVQEGKLCAVHCVNTVLQGPYFSEFDLAALASDLDQKERQVLMDTGPLASASDEFLSEASQNVSLDGNFSIQVLQKALEVWDLEVVPLDAPAVEESKYNPAELEQAFICHLDSHWFCIRKVNSEWFNFNSLYPAPEHLSKFYLSAYLDSLKGSGWSIFTVRGNFPKECSMGAESASGFGQWLTPDDAKKLTESCNQLRVSGNNNERERESSEMELIMAQKEEDDLNAAIMASLLTSQLSGSGTHASEPGQASLVVSEDKKEEGESNEG
ncbi:hypothetical protein LUZ60_010848 [Juncus effusus]|nr:hypothetical protein LUZ60_010848 [Juncus effusus]